MVCWFDRSSVDKALVWNTDVTSSPVRSYKLFLVFGLCISNYNKLLCTYARPQSHSHLMLIDDVTDDDTIYKPCIKYLSTKFHIFNNITLYLFHLFFYFTCNIPSLFLYKNKSVGNIASNLDPSSVLVQAPLCFHTRWPVFLRPRTNSQINRNCIDLSCLFDASLLNNDTSTF